MATELAEGVLLLSITEKELVIEATSDLAATSASMVDLVDPYVIRIMRTIDEQI